MHREYNYCWQNGPKNCSAAQHQPQTQKDLTVFDENAASNK